jgi:hypothetical protein
LLAAGIFSWSIWLHGVATTFWYGILPICVKRSIKRDTIILSS